MKPHGFFPIRAGSLGLRLPSAAAGASDLAVMLRINAPVRTAERNSLMRRQRL